MGVAGRVVTFVTAWILIYLIAYLIFMSPGTLFPAAKKKEHGATAKVKENPIRLQHEHAAAQVDTEVVKLTRNPYKSQNCYDFDDKSDRVAAVIIVHNDEINQILKTIASVKENSGLIPVTIVLIDDYSIQPMKDVQELNRLEDVMIVRTPKRLGFGGSKNFLLSNIEQTVKKADVLAFLEVGSIVNDNWLLPLLSTLSKHPKAVVYPAIDIIDEKGGKVFQSGNAVAGLDWSMKLKWEEIDASKNYAARIPVVGSDEISPDDETYSPATPPIYAVNLNFLSEIGGTINHETFSYWAPDNIELSLRTWLCGGEIIRQSCSRVAVRKLVNLKEDGSLTVSNVKDSSSIGYSQLAADRDALSLADIWLPFHRDYVFQSRFADRIPMKVSVGTNVKHPDFLNAINVNKCNSFEWYLDQIYPGLRDDITNVANAFVGHVTSNDFENIAEKLLHQYQKKTEFKKEPDFEIRAAAGGNTPVKKGPSKVSEEEHKQLVMKEFLCKDFVEAECKSAAAHGGCQNNLGFTLFLCPKSCGFCGDDGKYCSDHYLGKCPTYAAEGKCDSTDSETKDFMDENCRRSCGVCRRDGDPPLKVRPTTAKAVQEDIDTTISKMRRIDPYISQKLWKNNELPDPAGDTCVLKGTAHADLLRRLQLSTTSSDPTSSNKILCATYTMKEKHSNNVAMLRSTWGKRCDGWVAFSTEDDDTIPALNIPHEGPEDYQNMWQKSRSIWKYIGKNFADEFDWFLIGGDDMYYIIENLRDYLSSEKVTQARNSGKGLHIGRVFYPPHSVVFNSGGAGYILDKVALKRLTENIDSSQCFAHQKGFWEDVNVASCLQKAANIFPFDTRDEQGRERFHPFTPGNHLQYRIPKNKDWYALYNPDLKVGYDCCSPESVSFHYAPAEFMKKMHNYIYHCESKLQ